MVVLLKTAPHNMKYTINFDFLFRQNKVFGENKEDFYVEEDVSNVYQSEDNNVSYRSILLLKFKFLLSDSSFWVLMIINFLISLLRYTFFYWVKIFFFYSLNFIFR